MRTTHNAVTTFDAEDALKAADAETDALVWANSPAQQGDDGALVEAEPDTVDAGQPQ